MRIATTLAIVLAVAIPTLASAQAVDPDGAIHALTGRHHYNRHLHHHVRIPRYRRHHRHFGIALPPGTDRPGRSRTFIPAR